MVRNPRSILTEGNSFLAALGQPSDRLVFSAAALCRGVPLLSAGLRTLNAAGRRFLTYEIFL